MSFAPNKSEKLSKNMKKKNCSVAPFSGFVFEELNEYEIQT